MRNLVLCAILNILFFIDIVYSSVQITPVKSISLLSPNKNFSIDCNLTFDNESPTIIWKKDDEEVTSIEALKSRIIINPGKHKKIATLTIRDSLEEDVGNYSCIATENGKELSRGDIIVGRDFAIKVDANVNVVEDEKLRIECKVKGNPKLHWTFQNTSYYQSADRVILEDFTDKENKVIKNGVFIIEKVASTDAGIVACIGEEVGISSESKCIVRVKGKYAALWPFLGICAEVIILCAIIVIYEKKRNKTELEESDTDQSPDQKNTPDQGKDSNLRHRQ